MQKIIQKKKKIRKEAIKYKRKKNQRLIIPWNVKIVKD